MNTPEPASSASPPRPASPPPAEFSRWRLFTWSLRRELWEYRSVYLAPLAVAAVAIFGFLIGLVRLPERMREAAALGAMQQHEAIQKPYVIVALMLMLIEMLVAVYYCLDALYGERRDRSILFWKSLPVSDLTAVLAKASVPILVLPLVTFAITVAAQLLRMLLSSAVLAGSGLSAAPLWRHMSFLEMSWIHLFHLVGFHGLLFAPVYGWLLLASAWAKRAPLLWATLPLVAIGVLERIALDASPLAGLVRRHFLGDPQSAGPAGGMTMDMLAGQPLGEFLTRPALWIGLAVTAVFLFAAVRLRRLRAPI